MKNNKPKRKVIKKKVVIPTVVIVVVLVGATIFLLSPPLKPTSMKEQNIGYVYFKKFVEEKDNAFFDYLIAARLHVPLKKGDLETEYLNLISRDKVSSVSKNLREYVEKEKSVIDMIRKGIARKNCVVPQAGDEGVLSIRASREIARVMLAQARIKEIDGDYRGAYEDYLDTIRFGNDLARGGGLIHALINIAVDLMALDAMKSGLRDSDVQTLEMVIDGLKEVEDRFVPLSEILKKEYDYITHTHIEYMMKGRGNLKTTFKSSKNDGLMSNLKYNIMWLKISFNKNKIRKEVKDFMQKMIEYADNLPHKGGFKIDVPEYPTVAKVLLPNFSGFKSEYAEYYTRLRGTRLMAAVELYQRKHNELPQDLDVLVGAGIIEEVLIDPFSNEPFKYVDGKVYSIGRDFKE